MRNLLRAFVGALLGDAVPGGVLMPRRAGQAIGQPDRGGVEDDVAFGTVVERGAVFPDDLSVGGGLAFGDNVHAGKVHRGSAMPFPTEEPLDGAPLFSSPCLRRANAPASHRSNRRTRCRVRSFDLCQVALPSAWRRRVPCSEILLPYLTTRFSDC